MVWKCKNMVKFKIPGLKINGADFSLRPNQVIDIETLDPECMDRVHELMDQGWLHTIDKENRVLSRPEGAKEIIRVKTKPAINDAEMSKDIKKILERVLQIESAKTTIVNAPEKGDNRREKLDRTQLKAREKFLDSAQEEASSNISNFQTIETDDDVTSKADELGEIDI